ncbi:MAG: RagB/SusD family nutrient uptake outer membrane protein [Flammeovirgaceae bacterium]|nr:RagB/SusD family nutrient uptake outer membrane protein [Flammeovirgaceae bacterium]
MNKIQTDFGLFFAKVAAVNVRSVSELVRMRAMTGANTYKSLFTPEQNGIWQDAYQKILVNVETIIPLVDASEQNVHLGVAKILKGYVYLTLVDVYGDVPFTQALKGNEVILIPNGKWRYHLRSLYCFASRSKNRPCQYSRHRLVPRYLF